MANGMWEGAERATGTLARTGMGLLNYKAQREDAAANLKLRQDSFEIQKQQAGQAHALNQIKLDEAKKIQTARDKPLNIMLTPQYLAYPDEQKAEILKMFVDNKAVGPDGWGKTGEIMDFMGTVGNTEELFTKMMGPVVKKAEADAAAAYGELSQAIADGDEKKIEKAQKNYQRLFTEAQAKGGSFIKHQEKLQIDKANKVETAPSIQRKTRTIERDGKVYGQDYDFNPKTGEESVVKEYPTKVSGDVTINQNIPAEVKRQTAKSEAETRTRIKSPKFKDDVVKSAKDVVGRDWDILEPSEKTLAIREEAERQIKDVYGENAVFDIKNGVLGWYDGKKLIRRWTD